GALREGDRPLGDQLRIGADEGVEGARVAAEPVDRRERMRDRVVLIAVPHVGPRQHSRAGSGFRVRGSGFWFWGSGVLGFWQRECDNLRAWRRAEIASAARGDDDVL